MKKLVVTIPAYNEEKTLGKVLDDIKALKNEKYELQLLVVDDGSTDKTAAIARTAGAHVVSHPMNYGLAAAFQSEMKTALQLRADVIVHTDADQQYRPNDIPKLLRKLEEGNDLVLGSRFAGTIETMPLMKKIGNRIFSKVVSHITRLPISDAQTGFRAFTKDVAQSIEITSKFTYTQEQIIRAARRKFKIAEVPVYFDKRGANTESRLMRGWFDFGVRALINLLRVYRDYEPLKFFGFTGLLFFLTGFGLGVFIIYNITTTGGAGGIPRVILSALLMLTGIQIWMVGFLADMFRK